jgi:hypothetical protein
MYRLEGDKFITKVDVSWNPVSALSRYAFAGSMETGSTSSRRG